MLEVAADGEAGYGPSARAHFPPAAGDSEAFDFEGCYAPANEETESVLLFDGAGVRLEALGGSCLGLNRAGSRRRAAPPPPTKRPVARIRAGRPAAAALKSPPGIGKKKA